MKMQRKLKQGMIAILEGFKKEKRSNWKPAPQFFKKRKIKKF